jgi:hypothetical protein
LIMLKENQVVCVRPRSTKRLINLVYLFIFRMGVIFNGGGEGRGAGYR